MVAHMRPPPGYYCEILIYIKLVVCDLNGSFSPNFYTLNMC